MKPVNAKLCLKKGFLKFGDAIFFEPLVIHSACISTQNYRRLLLKSIPVPINRHRLEALKNPR